MVLLAGSPHRARGALSTPRASPSLPGLPTPTFRTPRSNRLVLPIVLSARPIETLSAAAADRGRPNCMNLLVSPQCSTLHEALTTLHADVCRLLTTRCPQPIPVLSALVSQQPSPVPKALPLLWGIQTSEDQGHFLPLMPYKAILCYICDWSHGFLQVYLCLVI